MRMAFFGSSLLSAYWNGAATYYRGLLRDLSDRGWRIAFYEPDAYERQAHRDIDPPDWAEVHVYDATAEAVLAVTAAAVDADVVVKASGVGVFDDLLCERALTMTAPGSLAVYWDVDAPATLADMATSRDHPLRRSIAAFDLVLTYGGGPPVVSTYRAFGARDCIPIYNALDPTTHFPVPPDARFAADLAFLGNRLPDREARVAEFFLDPAARLPGRSFLLGGAGWGDKPVPANVRCCGHVPTADHNAFNSTPLAVLNIARDSMAQVGYSPATRVFEAAGAGACLITDRWAGIEEFLKPEHEILVARDGHDVERLLAELTPSRSREIGAAARERVLADHTYARRGAEVDALLRDTLARKRGRRAA
ncbi:MAG: glycosyltransferase [Alphaproteobacteria bacterium]